MSLLRCCFALAVLLIAAAAEAQEPEVGDLLIASGSLSDPNFEKTVLLVVHQGDDGSVAVALNRPTWIDPLQAFPAEEALSDFPGKVYFGGPVSPSQPLIVFERGSRMPQNSRHVVGSVYVSTDLGLLHDLDLAAEDAPRVRLYAGHAAWVPGQLAREIGTGSWRLVPATADKIFAEDAATLWDKLPAAGNAVTASLY